MKSNNCVLVIKPCRKFKITVFLILFIFSFVIITLALCLLFLVNVIDGLLLLTFWAIMFSFLFVAMFRRLETFIVFDDHIVSKWIFGKTNSVQFNNIKSIEKINTTFFNYRIDTECWCFMDERPISKHSIILDADTTPCCKNTKQYCLRIPCCPQSDKCVRKIMTLLSKNN